MKKLMDMMEKKKSAMSKDDIQAKLDVLEELLAMAEEAKMDEVGSKMQKVTVAAKDKMGLKEGLEKAEEILEESPDMDMIASEDESMEESDEDKEEDEEELA